MKMLNQKLPNKKSERAILKRRESLQSMKKGLGTTNPFIKNLAFAERLKHQ